MLHHWQHSLLGLQAASGLLKLRIITCDPKEPLEVDLAGTSGVSGPGMDELRGNGASNALMHAPQGATGSRPDWDRGPS